MMSSPDGSHHSEKKRQKRKKSHRRIGPKRKGQRLRKQADSSGASSCATLSSKSEKTLSSTDSILADIDFDSDLEIDIESVVNEVANDDGFNNVDESGTEMSGRFSATTRSETSQHSIEPFDEDSEHKEICNVETEVEVEAIQIVDEGSIPELCSDTIPVVSHETQQFFNLETEVEVEATQMDPISPILGKGLKRRRPRLTMRPNKSNVRSENIEKASTSYQGPEPLAVKTTVVEKNFPSSQSAQASGQDNDNDNNSDMLQVITLFNANQTKCHAVLDGGSIKIIFLNKSHNVAVDKCIYWDCGIVRIYVHNLLLHSDHKIFKSVLPPVKITTTSLAMYLSSLADEIQKFNTCSGVRQYECLWRNSKGHIDTILFEETPCFRSLECLLFVNSYSDKRCGKCQAELRNFRKIMLRKEERIDKNASAESAKVPNKFLSPEELKEKAERLRKSKRQEKKRADRLKERLEKNKIKLDEYLHNDLLQIFMENQHKLTPEQRKFWEAQVNALKVKNKKNIHWDPVMIRLALHWQHQLGNTGYDSLRKFISLPCTRRLYDYSHVYKSKEGCQEEFLRDVKKLVEKSGTEKHFKYVNLMFDEMHIRSGLVISRSTGELIGYTNLSEVEVELKRLTDKDAGVSANYRPSLAKKVLVYLAKGITSSVSDVVAVYTTDDSLLASQLYSRTWEVVYFLECADIHVLSLTFDGAPTNIKFIQMHGKYNEHDAFLYATNNLAAEEKRPIYFIVDPPHLLKTCRNCLANSFCHKKCRKLWKNGEEMSWEVFVQIYEFSKTMKFCDTKLTKAHIKLTSFSCMKVIYAVQIFSASVANFLEKYKTHETFQKYQINELVKFIRLMNRFFDCMNAKVSNKGSSKEKSSDRLPYSNVNDERFHFLTGEFLQYFDDWEEDVKKRLGFTKKEKQRMNLSHQFLHAIRITVHSFVSAIRFMINIGATEVNGQDFNQDLLEQYFSTMRAAGGANNNPDERQVHLTRAKIHAIGQQGVTTTKGNTLVQKRDCSLDSSPLPALKRTRK